MYTKKFNEIKGLIPILISQNLKNEHCIVIPSKNILVVLNFLKYHIIQF